MVDPVLSSDSQKNQSIGILSTVLPWELLAKRVRKITLFQRYNHESGYTASRE